MGNTNSSAEFEYHIAAKDYKLIKKTKDRYFGEVTYVKNHKTEDMVLMKECEFGDQETYLKMVEDYTYYVSLKHTNLGMVYGFTGVDNHDMFKNNCYKLCLYFEYLPNTLESILLKKKIQLSAGSKQMIPNMSNPANFYGETELFQMMSQLISVLEYLQHNGVSHGDIRLGSCFIDHQENLKLFNRKLLCEGESSFQRAKNGDTTLFLTPYEFESIGKQKLEPVQDRYKVDVFCLGMMLLECATLKKSAQLYDWNNYTINLNLLSTRLLEVKQRYSPFIYEMLREMVRFDEGRRPDFILLKHYIVEEARLNLSLISAHHVEDEDNLLNELFIHIKSSQMLPSHEPSFRDQVGVYNSFFQKSIANSGTAKVEQKFIEIGDTPLMTKETARDFGGECSIPGTYREENVQEDLLESEYTKVHEIQGQTLVLVGKKSRTINNDLTSILMKKQETSTTDDNQIKTKLVKDLVHKKSPDTDVSTLKATHEFNEASQVNIESLRKKSNEFPVIVTEIPTNEEFICTPPAKEASEPINIQCYSSREKEGSSTHTYLLADCHNNPNYEYNYSAQLKVSAMEQKVQESLERARKCRESLKKPEDQAPNQDLLNSSVATFGAENHAAREDSEPSNTKVFNSESKKIPSRTDINSHTSAAKDFLQRDYLEGVYKYHSAKKEVISHYNNLKEDIGLVGRLYSYVDTPNFSSYKPKRAASNTRYSRVNTEPCEEFGPDKTEKDYSLISVKSLSFSTPEKLRNYNQIHQNSSRVNDTKPKVTGEFVLESNSWNKGDLLQETRINQDLNKPSLLEQTDPQVEETFQRAIERTQQTKDFLRKMDEKDSISLSKRRLNV